jgi:hypothetical protein
LGNKYFYNFIRQHTDIIHQAKIQKFCINCLKWATYVNIEKMYSLVYDKMVLAGVAIRLDDPVCFNKDNGIVDAGSNH